MSALARSALAHSVLALSVLPQPLSHYTFISARKNVVHFLKNVI